MSITLDYGLGKIDFRDTVLILDSNAIEKSNRTVLWSSFD